MCTETLSLCAAFLQGHQQQQGVQVVDVKHLDPASQRALLERVMDRGGAADNLPLLIRVQQRMQR